MSRKKYLFLVDLIIIIHIILLLVNGGNMKKMFLSALSIFGMLIALTVEVSAASVLSKVSTLVIIFVSIAGIVVWGYALKKRKDLDGE